MTKQDSKPNSSSERFPIVGIGASAGGFDALRRLLEAMPEDPGVALVIIQHLAPDKPSLAPELLARYTTMEVRQIDDQPVVKPGHVYVIPPGKFLSIVNGQLQLTQMEGPRRPPVVVDFFFRALAKDQRQCAVGVILSGTGSDGTLGVKAIKESGGLVLVQAVGTAEHSGMPEQAIRSGFVDQVLAPEAIPEALVSFANHDYICSDADDGVSEAKSDVGRVDVSPDGEADAIGAGAGPTEEEEDDDRDVESDNSSPTGIDGIVAQLRDSGNRDFRSYKHATLLRRTRRRMCLHHIDAIDDYLAFLKKNPSEIDLLARDLLISVTDFFRDPDAWDELARVVIPDIVEKKSAEEAVRVWVAGCATGEEAYTVAMLMLEEIGKQQKACPLQIFASDIDKRALDEARAGQYPVSIVADVSAERIKRFFSLQDGDLHYQINKSLRETVVFAEQNLLVDPPFSQLDLILCRNVLIYLKPETQQKLIRLFHFALRHEGYLMLGSAETISRQDDLFETLQKRWRIYRGIGPTRHGNLDLSATLGSTRRPSEMGDFAPQRRDQQVSSLAQQKLVDMLAPRAILVDRHHRIRYISGDVNPYILHQPGVQNDDLLGKLREGLRSKLRGAIREALAEKSPVSVQCRVKRESSSYPVRVEIRYVTDRGQQESFALVVFDEEAAQLSSSSGPTGGGADNQTASATSDQPPSAPDAVKELDVDDDSIIRQLEEELSATKDDLQSTIEQFEASNEEFKASNEEVMSINEELQSTNEELETSKEELQSLNEEMSTVNLQLASKVEELELKHADLENLISATDVATVCLGTDLRIRWFTPATEHLIRVQKSDIGRPLRDLQNDFVADDLQEECSRVLKHLIAADHEVDCSDGRSFIRRVVPYRADDHRIGGVVITMVEITSRREREKQLLASEEQLRELTKNLESQVRERTELLGVLQHVTRLANEASSIDEALQSSVAKITEFNGWIVGHVWQLASDRPANDPQMESSGIWHIRDKFNIGGIDKLEEFQRVTAQTRFSKGDGLIGRVTQSARPEWINDVRKQPDTFRRSINGLELHAAIAFPIMIGGEAVAVMEFFSEQAISPQQRFLEIVPDIGIQLGHAISRQRLQTIVANIAEAEQRRIGRELHDGIAQQLTGGSLIAQSLKRSLPETLPAQIEHTDHLIELLNQTHDDVRQLSSGLLPESVQAADLAPALRGLAAKTSKHFDVRCEVDDDRYDESLLRNDSTANLIFLIAREAVHNAIKHGDARKIEIILSMDDMLRLSVHDNGSGFDTNRHKANTNGLRIMRYRAETVGGNLEIESSEEYGTRVLLNIPASAMR